MKRYSTLIYFLIGLWLFFACQNRAVKIEPAQNHSIYDEVPENLWISPTFVARADSMLDYYNAAKRTLAEQDTIGAEIYFNQAFVILSHFSEEDRLTLQYWDRYDTLLQSLSEAYERIYLANNIELEAEEMREDMIEFTQLDISDSVLFGGSTVIDSSGPIPITINSKVRLAIQYFQTKGRVVFTRWLERSGRYERLVRDILREKGVPEDLVYLAMIESGFNPRARSYAKAVGMWQFISATGRYYGLRNDWWFDERRDIIKSTHAAAHHLLDLYERFGDWYLALAGYNCNPKRVEANIRRYKTRDFWQLKGLPRQTKNYVPTFLAATIIAKNPRKFGFFVEKMPPVEMDIVQLSESVDLNVIAKITGNSYEEIKDLNPAVLHWVTPDGVKDFNIYLPKGKKDIFLAEYSKISDSEKRSWVRHRIERGETLSTIARKYNTSIAVLKSTNHLKGNTIHTGKYLLIPVPQNKSHRYAVNQTSSSVEMRNSSAGHSDVKKVIRNVPGHKKIIYEVKPGDTLGEIAEKYNTTASKIRSWNGLAYGRHIFPKQKLNIWVSDNFEAITTQTQKQIEIVDNNSEVYYVVKEGDTLWDIAQKYNLSIKDLKKMNEMRGSLIKPGDRLRISKN